MSPAILSHPDPFLPTSISLSHLSLASSSARYHQQAPASIDVAHRRRNLGCGILGMHACPCYMFEYGLDIYFANSTILGRRSNKANIVWKQRASSSKKLSRKTRHKAN
nr:hypothetical protein CFP56_15355 [Quercus suber]